MLQSRMRFTKSKTEPRGFTRAHICVSDIDKPSFQEPGTEPYPVRRFVVVDYSHRMIFWREPVWEELSATEFAEDWPQVAALVPETAAAVLEAATFDQLAALDALHIQPLLESPKASIRLLAIRALSRVAPEMRVEGEHRIVEFPRIAGGAR